MAAAPPLREARLYRSDAGRAAVLASYDRQLARLTFPHERRSIGTRLGQTHVLTMGPPDASPIVVIHGVNFPAPFVAPMVVALSARFRIHLPDVVGQPGRSDERRPDNAGHAYAHWLGDVMDGLGLSAAPVIGLSFGGAIALDFAATTPSRVTKLALIVPAGIAGVRPDFVAMAHMFLDWSLYRWFPDRARLAAVVRPLAWELDDVEYDHFDAVLRHVRWLIPPPGPFGRADLKNLSAPCAVYVAAHDLFFPGEKLIAAASQVLPNLADSAVYDSSHFPTRAMQTDVMARIAQFLAS